MKRLNSYITLEIFIILAAYAGCWFERKEIFELIEHNRMINSIIMLLFFISSLYVLSDAINSARKGRLWSKQKDHLSDDYSIKIFGREFYKITDLSNDASHEVVSLWKKSIEWKSHVLEYISGTLIGIGLLGTFIGLMHTMGSVFNVLSTSVSGKDLVSELGVPLSGMSTAFSASMLGLSTSLTVGLLSVLTSKVNNELIAEVENWSLEVKGNKGEDGNNGQEHHYLSKVVSQVADNSNLVKLNNEYFSDIISAFSNNNNYLVDLNLTMSNISDNTVRINDALNGLNGLFNESNSKIEIVRMQIESLIKRNIQGDNENKKSWRDIEQGVTAIKSLIENNEDNLNKFHKIQEIMYESGFFCLNEIVSMRKVLESSLEKKNENFIEGGNE